MSFSWENLG